jgi:hypothetical protein
MTWSLALKRSIRPATYDGKPVEPSGCSIVTSVSHHQGIYVSEARNHNACVRSVFLSTSPVLHACIPR